MRGKCLAWYLEYSRENVGPVRLLYPWLRWVHMTQVWMLGSAYGTCAGLPPMRETSRYARVTWMLPPCQAAASQQLLGMLVIASFLSLGSAQGKSSRLSSYIDAGARTPSLQAVNQAGPRRAPPLCKACPRRTEPHVLSALRGRDMRAEGQWPGLLIKFLLGAVIRSSTWHQEARAHTSTAAGHASALSSISFVQSSGVLSQCRCRCQWCCHTVLTAPEHLTTQTSAGMRLMPAHESPRRLIRRRCSLPLWNAGHRVAPGAIQTPFVGEGARLEFSPHGLVCSQQA